MQYYIELTLIEQRDFSIYQLWGKLYTQLHLALVELQHPNKMVSIGVSFPEYYVNIKKGKYYCSLGSKLRIFSNTTQELDHLNLEKAFERLTDYLHLSKTKPVPDNIVNYLNVKRHRADFSLKGITHRYAKRKGISFEQAKKEQNLRYAELHNLTIEEAEKHYEQPITKNLPYIQLKSLSSGKEFTLIIEQIPTKKFCDGNFSTYGLSKTSTVPHW